MQAVETKRKAEIAFRPLAPRETDIELLLLAVSVTVAAGCFFWLAFGLPWPKCWFRQMTGIPCPTCGATRSILSLVRGNIRGAISHNPLAFICYFATLFLDLYSAFVLLFRLPRLRVAGLPAEVKKRLFVFVCVAVASNWIYLVANH